MMNGLDIREDSLVEPRPKRQRHSEVTPIHDIEESHASMVQSSVSGSSVPESPATLALPVPMVYFAPEGSPPQSSAPSSSSWPKITSPHADLYLPEHLEVAEVECKEEKDDACALHLSKNTFREERELVKLRIYHGKSCDCRTWVLRTPPSSANSESNTSLDECRVGRSRSAAFRGRSEQSFTSSSSSNIVDHGALAAATIRFNAYQAKTGSWAHILNTSTRRERQGFGTILIAGVERLLRVEGVDVIILYPAENGRAPAFWSSLGFAAQASSFLPDEELVPHEHGGPLLPEFDLSTRVVLPRWEKQIAKSPLSVAADSFSSDASLNSGRKRGRVSHRRVSSSRLGGEALSQAVDALKAHRNRWKAHRSACLLKGDATQDMLLRCLPSVRG